MPKPNKKKEEILAQQRLAKKRQYQRLKNDSDLYEERKLKNKIDYLRRKENKKILTIDELSPREQRSRRKKWRENTRRYRQKLAEEKKKQEQQNVINIDRLDTSKTVNYLNKNKQDPLGPTTSSVCTVTSPEKLMIKKVKYRESKKRLKLLEIIKTLKKQNKALRNYIKKLKQKMENTNSQTESFNLKSMFNFKNSKADRDTAKLLQNKLLMTIHKFYEEDVNSRIGAGKKEFITRGKERKQKRYLCAPLNQLYEKFKAENKNFNCSYSTFCRNRPFWVTFPKESDRDTCMCSIHLNMDLLGAALHKANIIHEKNSIEMIASLCCSMYNSECLRRICSICKEKVLDYKEFSNDRELEYYSWTRQNKQYVTTEKKKREISITAKSATKVTPIEAIQKLDKDLPDFFRHCYNILNQFNEIKKLKERLAIHETILHIDFSENYAIKFATEVQALHFGGSRSQIALHTAVVYTHNFQSGKVEPISVCTVSDCVRHDASAIWAHLTPLIQLALEKNPFTTTLYFLSDSPTSQYRNKFIFYMISQLHVDFPQLKEVIWNYSEKGHGKGAPDGVGAVLKRTADAAVKFGEDVANLTDFVKIMKSRVKNIIIIPIAEKDIIEKEKSIPKNATPFRGTLSVHQVLWKKDQNYITCRELSCFSCEPGEICRHGFHIGFMKNPAKTTDSIQQSKDFVVPIRRSKKCLSVRDLTGMKDVVVDDPIPKIRPKMTVLDNMLVSAGEDINNLNSPIRPVPSTSKIPDTNESALDKENVYDADVADSLQQSKDFVALLGRSNKCSSVKRADIPVKKSANDDPVPKKRPKITVLENVLLCSAGETINNLKSQIKPVPSTSKVTDRNESAYYIKENLYDADVEDLVAPNIVMKKPNC